MTRDGGDEEHHDEGQAAFERRVLLLLLQRQNQKRTSPADERLMIKISSMNTCLGEGEEGIGPRSERNVIYPPRRRRRRHREGRYL